MKQRDENFLSMVSTTVNVCDKYRSVWEQTQPFAAAMQAVNTARTDMSQALQGAELLSTGVTLDKETAGDRAIALAVKLARFTQAYAMDQENNTLHDQMDVSVTLLDRMPDEQLAPRLQDLIDRMRALPDLGSYGVTPEKLDALQSAASTFANLKAAPRNTIVSRKSSNDSIPELLRRMRAALYKTDRLIALWEEDHPKFVSEYHAARVIIDLGGKRHKDEEA